MGLAEPERTLPEHARQVIDAPLVPFDQLPNYRGEDGLYLLNTRKEAGYGVVTLYDTYARFGTSVITRIVRGKRVMTQIETPSDKVLDRFDHVLAIAPVEVAYELFDAPPAEPNYSE